MPARGHAPNDNQAIVMAAVAHNGMALTYVSEEMKADRDIVLAAVTQDGRNSHDVFNMVLQTFEIMKILYSQHWMGHFTQ